MSISIRDFDAVGAAEAGAPLELLSEAGDPTGIILTVVGDHAAVVQRYLSKIVRELRAREEMAKKQGKPTEFDLEKLKEQGVEGAALRVLDWTGPAEPFSPAELRAALKRNPHWVEQITTFSGNLANFTKKA